MEDLKTYIPGVGFLVTSLESGETDVVNFFDFFEFDEVDEVDEDAENELVLQAQCQAYDEALLHYEDAVDF